MTGSLAKIVNAQNVEFRKGTDEYVLLTDIELADESIMDRTHTRAGPLDVATYSLIEITATVTLDKAGYDAFRLMRQLTARGALPSSSYNIRAQNVGTAATDDWTETGTFICRRMVSTGSERGKYQVRLTFRLYNNNSLTET